MAEKIYVTAKSRQEDTVFRVPVQSVVFNTSKCTSIIKSKQPHGQPSPTLIIPLSHDKICGISRL